jgi:hypothetical protein
MSADRPRTVRYSQFFWPELMMSDFCQHRKSIRFFPLYITYHENAGALEQMGIWKLVPTKFWRNLHFPFSPLIFLFFILRLKNFLILLSQILCNKQA